MGNKHFLKRRKILIFGEEFTGKKLVVNTILGRLIFSVDRIQAPLTLQSGVVLNRRVTWVYSPGWDPLDNPDVPLRTLRRAYGCASKSKGQGLHALLLTVPIYLNREYNEKMAKRLLKLFDDHVHVWRHTILLFTRADLLDLTGLDGYLNKEGFPLQALVERCERRYHALNNRDPNNRKQVKELLEKIDQLVAESDGKTFQLVDTPSKLTTEPVDPWKKVEEQRFNSRPEEPMFRSLRQAEENPELLLEQNDTRHRLEYVHVQDEGNEGATGFYPKGNLDSEPGPQSQLVDPLVSQVFSRNDSKDEETQWLNGSNSNDEERSEEPTEPSEQPDLQEFIKSTDSEEDVNPKKGTEVFCTELTETHVEKPVQGEQNPNRLQNSQNWGLQLAEDGTTSLNISYMFYIHQQGAVRIDVFQLFLCWRNPKQSNQTVWISFFICCVSIDWVLFKTQGALFPLPQIRDGGIHQYSKKSDGAIPLQNKRNDGGIAQRKIKNNGRIAQHNKSNDGGIPQHNKSNDGAIPQHNKSNDGGIPQHNKSNNGGIPQHNKSNDGRIPQHNKSNDGGIPQHNKSNDGGIPQHNKRNDGGIPQHNKSNDGGIPQHNKSNDGGIPQHNKSNDGGIPQHNKSNDGAIPQHNKSNDGGIPQHNKSNDGAIPQHNKSNDGGIPQHNKSNNGGIPQHNKSNDGRIPQHNKSNDGGIPQHNKSNDGRIPQHNKSNDGGIPQHNKSNDGGIPQHNKSNDGGIPQHNKSNNGGIPQHNKSNDGGIPQHNKSNDGAIPQHNKSNNGGIPQHNKSNDGGIPQHNKSNNGGIPQHNKRNDGGIPQHNKSNDGGISQHNKRNDKGISQHSRKKDNEGFTQQSQEENNEGTPQHFTKADDRGRPQYKSLNGEELVPQLKKKEENQRTSKRKKKSDDEGRRQNCTKIDGEFLQHKQEKDDGGILQQSRMKDDKGTPQYHNRCSMKNSDGGTTQHFRKRNGGQGGQENTRNGDDENNTEELMLMPEDAFMAEEVTVKKNLTRAQDKEEKTPRDASETRRSSWHKLNQVPKQGNLRYGEKQAARGGKFIRSQSVERIINLSCLRETEVRKGGGIRKTTRRSRSLERFIEY